MKKKTKENKSYAVIGMGLFGQSLACQLSELNEAVLAMDVRADLVQQMEGVVTEPVVGDAQDKEVLRAHGIQDMDCVIIAIGDDLAASVLIAMNIMDLQRTVPAEDPDAPDKDIKLPYIVCKAHNDTHKRVLERLGVKKVVIPEREQAQRLARNLHSQNVLDYIELSGDYGIQDLAVPKSWVGKTLKELNIRAKLGINIIAVKNNEKINVSPSADYLIREKDVLVVLGDNYSLEAVQKL